MTARGHRRPSHPAISKAVSEFVKSVFWRFCLSSGKGSSVFRIGCRRGAAVEQGQEYRKVLGPDLEGPSGADAGLVRRAVWSSNWPRTACLHIPVHSVAQLGLLSSLPSATQPRRNESAKSLTRRRPSGFPSPSWSNL